MELFSPKELARLLSVSLPTIYKWAEKGALPSYKLEGLVRFSRDDVLEFLQERRRIGQRIVKG